MHRMLLSAGLAAAGLLALGTFVPARALMVAIPAGPAKVAQSDAIVVGQVVGLLDKDVEAAAAPGSPQKISYRIALIRVTDTLKGGKLEETIRVGFPAPPADRGGINNGGGLIARPAIARISQTFEVGQDGLFFLKKHPEGQFLQPAFPYGSYVSSMGGAEDPTGANNFYEQEVKLTRAFLKVLDNPTAILKSANGQDRYLAAVSLVQLYRTPQGGNKTVPVDAAESRLILKALAEADWIPTDPNNPASVRGALDPMQIFSQLGVGPQDGYQAPKFQRGDQFPAYQLRVRQSMRDWLVKNADTYRIQKFVPGPGGRNTGGVRLVPQAGQAVPVPGGVQILPAPGGVRIQVQPLPARVDEE